MLLFLILGLIILGGIALCIWGNLGGYDGRDCAILTGGAIIFITLIVLSCILTNVPWKRSVEYDLAKYNELKTELLQTSDRDIVQKELVDKVYEMNIYIEKNRIYRHSLWKGWLYSEEIGNLPKLELKK